MTQQKTLLDKSVLYDMWECVRQFDGVYDFDTTMTADQLMDDLSEIINLELLKLNK